VRAVVSPFEMKQLLHRNLRKKVGDSGGSKVETRNPRFLEKDIRGKLQEK